MSEDRPAPRVSNRWLLHGFSFALATILGAVAAAQHHVVMVESGGDPTTRHAILMGMPFWYIWALLAPLVIWFAQRFPIAGPRLWRNILAHVGFAAVVILLHSAMEMTSRVVFDLLNPTSVRWFGRIILINIDNKWISYLLSYGIILGAYQMWSVVQQLREREMAASRLAVQLAQARLASLQNQLKPHFFFNAMNTVAMLVRAQNNTQAIRTLTGMSDLLRHVLAEDPPAVVPLKDELRFIERYLDIERIRFHDRLTVSIDADEGTLEAPVPNLMLQPLVENAVRHGISAKAGARTIVLTARIQDGKLLISVRDDGPGFGGGARSTRGSGVGLRNTRARLVEMYGDDARLELTDAPGGGAIVAIELPANVPVHSPVPIRA